MESCRIIFSSILLDIALVLAYLVYLTENLLGLKYFLVVGK